MSRFKHLDLHSGAEGGAQKSGEGDAGDLDRLVLGQKMFEDGEFEMALRLFSRAMESNPADYRSWRGQILALIEMDELSNAEVWAEKALEKFPNNPDLLACKAVVLGRQGRVEEALAYSDEAVRQEGASPFVWLARADVLMVRGDRSADFCIDKALGMASDGWFYAWLAGRMKYYHGQYAGALKLFHRAIELNSEHFFLWLELARCQWALGLDKLARQSIARARELRPDSKLVREVSTQIEKFTFWHRILGSLKRVLGI